MINQDVCSPIRQEGVRSTYRWMESCDREPSCYIQKQRWGKPSEWFRSFWTQTGNLLSQTAKILQKLNKYSTANRIAESREIKIQLGSQLQQSRLFFWKFPELRPSLLALMSILNRNWTAKFSVPISAQSEVFRRLVELCGVFFKSFTKSRKKSNPDNIVLNVQNVSFWQVLLLLDVNGI